MRTVAAMTTAPAPDRIEWPTLLLILACTGTWMAATAFASAAPWLALPALTLALVLHSSLQHEVLHGHPTPSRTLNAALVFPAVGLAIPYERFRDLHLAHHRDATLTDPHDDPESNYLDPAVWARLPGPVRALLMANNTLAGRMLLGPAIGLAAFWRDEARAARARDPAVLRAWALHALGLVPVLLWLGEAGTVSAPAYLACAYAALSILRIRTFLEHRAHESARGRSVIIEDRGPLAFLFLNNNLHAVHHGHPGLAWYRIPEFYRARRERFLQMNQGYRYGSYAEIFARHFLRRKDPVAHPLAAPRE
jgi:fatty acid desaturase